MALRLLRDLLPSPAGRGTEGEGARFIARVNYIEAHQPHSSPTLLPEGEGGGE